MKMQDKLFDYYSTLKPSDLVQKIQNDYEFLNDPLLQDLYVCMKLDQLPNDCFPYKLIQTIVGQLTKKDIRHGT